jgi:hypothetical protein
LKYCRHINMPPTLKSHVFDSAFEKYGCILLISLIVSFEKFKLPSSFPGEINQT